MSKLRQLYDVKAKAALRCQSFRDDLKMIVYGDPRPDSTQLPADYTLYDDQATRLYDRETKLYTTTCRLDSIRRQGDQTI